MALLAVITKSCWNCPTLGRPLQQGSHLSWHEGSFPKRLLDTAFFLDPCLSWRSRGGRKATGVGRLRGLNEMCGPRTQELRAGVPAQLLSGPGNGEIRIPSGPSSTWPGASAGWVCSTETQAETQEPLRHLCPGTRTASTHRSPGAAWWALSKQLSDEPRA